MKLLSIIIPIYNLEKYLAKCLDSLILEDKKQMELLEVLMVNDGSKDNSIVVANEYVAKYPTVFRLIDKENGGSGSCRNRGLREATGKYVRFLDGDDWLSNLDKLVKCLQDFDVDIVFTHMNKYYAEKGEYVLDSVHEEYGVVKHLKDFAFSNNTCNSVLTFWYSTYKREILLFDVDIFVEKTMYSDTILFALPAIKAKTFVCMDYTVYNYFIGRADQSANQERKPKNIIARAKQAIYVDRFWQQNKPHDLDKNIEEWISFFIYHNAWHVFNTIPILPFVEAKELEKEMRHILLYRSSASKNYNRYKCMPFSLYFMINKIRFSLGKI